MSPTDMFSKLNIWWPMTLFLDIYFLILYRYSIEVDEEQILHTTFRLGFACGYVGWMWAFCLDSLKLY